MSKKTWRYERKAAAKGFVKGIAFGVVVGAIAAAFLNPKSGAENRAIVTRGAKKVSKSAEDKLFDLDKDLGKRIDKMRDIADDLRGEEYENSHRLLTRAELVKQDLQDAISGLTANTGEAREQLLKDSKRLVADGARILSELERIAKQTARRNRDDEDTRG